MTDQALGRLSRVDLRDIWTREENLVILGDTLGIDLELEAQEKAVGPFRADVLCKDIGTGAWVLIENQLERTDHGHLGQLLTYASGLEAVTVVWIAARFTDEHRSTLDWLNRITDDRGTCKTLLDQEPDPRQGTGLGAIGNDFWLERRFVPPSEEPDRGVGFCFGLVFGVRA